MVVADCTSNPGNVGPMPVVIERQGVIIDEVPSLHIIDVSIPIIIDTIVADLLWIGPDVLSKVHVGHINAGIRDCDNGLHISRSNIPRRDCPDIGTGVSGVQETPLEGKFRVVREAHELDPVIRLNGENGSIAFI